MKIYMAQKGDTLGKIAKKNKMEAGMLSDANPHIVDPGILQAGTKIKIPQNRKHVHHQPGSHSKEKEKGNDRNAEYVNHLKRPMGIEEDDIKEGFAKPALPYTLIHEAKKYPLEVGEKAHKSVEGERANIPSSRYKRQSIRHNPVSIIRNNPHDNIPENHLYS